MLLCGLSVFPFKSFFVCTGFDAAYKMFTLFLPLVKSIMCLIPSIHHTGLPGRKDHADKGTFGPIAIKEKDLPWNAVV